jgi:DNA-binding transcriptional ArsR family regulator
MGCPAPSVEYRTGNDPIGGLDGQSYLTYLLNMDGLSQTFSALADPTRRAILARLATGAATVGELAEPFDMSLPAVSRHLRVLTDAGLIERHTEAQWRRCELRGEGFRAAADWIEYYRRFWETQFDKLDAFLKRTAPTKPAKGKRHGRVR